MSLKRQGKFFGLNIPDKRRSMGQQRRASSSCLTIQEFEQ
jgi:hypothetical protein